MTPPYASWKKYKENKERQKLWSETTFLRIATEKLIEEIREAFEEGYYQGKYPELMDRKGGKDMKEIEVPQWGIGEFEKFKETMEELQAMWEELHGDLEFLHSIPKGMRSTQVAVTVLYLMRKGII